MFHTKTCPTDLESLCPQYLHTGWSSWMCGCPHRSGGQRGKNFGRPCRSVLCFRLEIRQPSLLTVLKFFCVKPTNLLARAQTFSSYKHHNTVKVLISITPQGCISFVSEAWGGGGTHLRQISHRKLQAAQQLASWGSSYGRQGIHSSRWCCP